MWKSWLVAGVLAGLVTGCSVSSPWQREAMEFKFVKAGPAATNAKGDQVSFTERAASLASELSAEGWTLVSASAANTEAGSFVVLAFARPKD